MLADVADNQMQISAGALLTLINSNLYSYQIAMIGLGLGSFMFRRVLGYGVSLALSVPGGLFEVALGVLLLAKGFPDGQSRDRAALAHHESMSPTRV